jgi:hypothetical protein
MCEVSMALSGERFGQERHASSTSPSCRRASAKCQFKPGLGFLFVASSEEQRRFLTGSAY